MDKKEIYTFLDSHANKFIRISDHIWDYAETAFAEYKSAALLCDTLEQAGFTVRLGIGDLETAFVASYGRGKPVIGFLAEYDALAGLNQMAGSAIRQPTSPGDADKAGHGCGHNLFGTAAVAAALAVKEYLDATHAQGTVVVYGCPGEEGGSGKAFMARDGVFDGCDIALNWHPSTCNSITSGSSLANIQVLFKFYGTAAHASSAPERGRSALGAVELMNMGTQFLREHMEDADRVHYAITNSGGFSPNVVQARADVLYLIRSPKSANARSLYERVCKIAQGAAHMTETRLEIDFVKACSEKITLKTLTDLLYRNMEQAPQPQYTKEEYAFAQAIRASFEAPKHPLEDAVRRCGEEFRPQLIELYRDNKGLADFLFPRFSNEVVSKGSTDVGDTSWVCPTGGFVSVTAAVGTPAHSWQFVSCNKTSIAHKGLLFASKVLSGAAIDLLEDPALVEQAKQEHARRTAGGYACPIPKGVKPRAIADL